jgi:hypothetical protein
MGTLGSGALYSLIGEDFGELAGTDAVAGLAACFLAGTVSSVLAALITFKIDDNESGLKCGSCCTIVAVKENSNPADDTDVMPGDVSHNKDVVIVESSYLDTVDPYPIFQSAFVSSKRHMSTQTGEVREVATQTGDWDDYLPRPPSMSDFLR